jgi:hypothetical protein
MAATGAPKNFRKIKIANAGGGKNTGGYFLKTAGAPAKGICLTPYP